jgi:hypothetical protein
MSKSRRVQARATSAANNRLGPILLIGSGVVVLLVVIIWQLSLLPATTVGPASANLQIPYPEIARTSLKDAKQAYDEGSAIFLDVRDSGTFGSKNIPRSINIPLTELESRLNELPKDRWILTVCT